jgi:hypothetical protein
MAPLSSNVKTRRMQATRMGAIAKPNPMNRIAIGASAG